MDMFIFWQTFYFLKHVGRFLGVGLGEAVSKAW
jgi:hypothetical protein